MSFLSNAHTHTTRCDGKSSVGETVAAARALGFVSLGFSGHASQGFDPEYSMAQDAQREYFAELRAYQAQGGTPRIWAGLELDACAMEPYKSEGRKQADYIIGSTHYLTLDYHGKSVSVDGEPELLRAYVNDAFDGDGLEMARAYYRQHVDAALRDRPDILGHFDLARKNAARIGLFDENDAKYRKIALDALERVSACGAVLELNTGAMARGYLQTPYPTLELLGAWRELGGKATITSDCHDCRYLDFGYAEAVELMKKAGYKNALRLGARDELWEEVAL